MSANKVIKDEIEHWSIEDVGLWISEVCKRNEVTDYRNAFMSKGVNGEMLLKLTAKELEEFLEIRALADVKALENNINALRTAIQLSEHQLGRSDNSHINDHPDNNQLQIQVNQFHLDAVPEHLQQQQQQSSNDHAHDEHCDHDHKSESYSDFKEEDFVCRWDNCINQSNFAIKFGTAAELALHVAEHVLSNPLPQLNSTCLACGRSFIGMTDEQITAHFKTPSHSFVPNINQNFMPPPLSMSNKMNSMLPPMPVQMHDHHAMDSSQMYQFMHHENEMHGHDVGPKRRVRSKKRKAEEMEPASIEDSMDDLRRYICDITGCGKTFKRSGHLKRHKLVHAPATERERYSCKEASCSKSYSTKYDLAAHVRQVHMGAPQFKCSVRGCCRRFVRKESLDKHLQTFDHSKAAMMKLDGQSDNEAEDEIAEGSLLASIAAEQNGEHHGNAFMNQNMPTIPQNMNMGMPDQQAENLMYLQTALKENNNNVGVQGVNTSQIKTEMTAEHHHN